MQSAARVPILISFEVEEYEGPDNDPILSKEVYSITQERMPSLLGTRSNENSPKKQAK